MRDAQGWRCVGVKCAPPLLPRLVGVGQVPSVGAPGHL